MNQENHDYTNTAIVDLAAIAHNVRRFKDLVSGSLLMAVVKAEAYGHGSASGTELVAKAAMGAGADMFGVAHVSEGIALRESLRQETSPIPILAWLHTKDTDFERALEYGLSLGVGSLWELRAVAGAAVSTGVKATVHLKIDTGLGRNGSTVRQWPALVVEAKKFQDEGIVDVTGIFSHCAVADEPDNPETSRQLGLFHDAVRVAREAGLGKVIRHIANTPATLAHPETRLDMVRIGLGMYGLSPFSFRNAEACGLKPAMTLSTRVAQVKDVPAGQGVSYGLTYFTGRPTRLALVPIGYGDGIPRTVIGAPVLIRGERYVNAGRIAMDQFVVDLGPDSEVEPGDPVTLFGPSEPVRGKEGEVPVEEWAEAAQTINYEIVTRIGPRVLRRYINAGRYVPQWEVKVVVQDAAQTQALARKIAGAVSRGDLIVLNGGLGAGKTTFAQGLGSALGISEPITSPTFVLMRYHENPAEDRKPDLVHVDAYRLDSAADIDDLDLERVMDRSVTVIEWGEGKAEHINDSRLVVDIAYAAGSGEDVREVTVRGYGSRWQKSLELA